MTRHKLNPGNYNELDFYFWRTKDMTPIDGGLCRFSVPKKMMKSKHVCTSADSLQTVYRLQHLHTVNTLASKGLKQYFLLERNYTNRNVKHSVRLPCLASCKHSWYNRINTCLIPSWICNCLEVLTTFWYVTMIR